MFTQQPPTFSIMIALVKERLYQDFLCTWTDTSDISIIAIIVSSPLDSELALLQVSLESLLLHTRLFDGYVPCSIALAQGLLILPAND